MESPHSANLKRNLNHMKTKAVTLSSWDDLVFETRNKNYGAYVLRKMYLRRLVLGLGGSVAMMTLLIVAPQMFPPMPKFVKPLSTEVSIEVLPPPPTLKKEEPRPRSAQQQVQRRNTPPLVVTTPVEPAPIVDDIPEPTLSDDVTVVGSTTPLVGDVAPVVEPPKTFFTAEVMPQFPDMMKYLSRKLNYPPAAQRIGAQGTVFVSFVVDGDGKVVDVALVRGFHPDCDKEAMRVIQGMKGWTGGRQNGTPVRVRMVLPIKFSLGNR
jgi:periplasmic protein TonB